MVWLDYRESHYGLLVTDLKAECLYGIKRARAYAIKTREYLVIRAEKSNEKALIINRISWTVVFHPQCDLASWNIFHRSMFLAFIIFFLLLRFSSRHLSITATQRVVTGHRLVREKWSYKYQTFLFTRKSSRPTTLQTTLQPLPFWHCYYRKRRQNWAKERWWGHHYLTRIPCLNQRTTVVTK